MVRIETLDALIDAAGVPLTTLAKRAKIDPTSLRMLRLGQVARPRVSTVAKLAAALKVDVARVRAACEASRDAAAKE
jgi:transcriptional regulator with XRE-family HTH domain